MSYSLLLTIDVEDWFQVENFKPYIPFSSWPSRELRVEKNTHRLLDLLDSQNEKPAIGKEGAGRAHATFFVLGWIAERLPQLVREIHARGHEVGSHGYRHDLCNLCSPQDLKADLIESKKCLEDIIGVPIFGYRAPSFSISNDILKIIEECGYLYDSSFNSFGMHSRYGHLDLGKNSRRGIAAKISDSFYELPVSNMSVANRVFPWGGGGYFRLTPISLFLRGVRSILDKDEAYLFYLHPWEIDPEQPKVKEAPLFARFRHYVNLEKNYSRLERFLFDFGDCTLTSCHNYLKVSAGL